MKVEIWKEWKTLTQFWECSRIAFRKEVVSIENMNIKSMDGIDIFSVEKSSDSSDEIKSNFKISLVDYIGMLSNDSFLSSMVLMSSYALCERHAQGVLGVQKLEGGIESWGSSILNKTGNSWKDVHGGINGILEVAVVRNMIAHGQETIPEEAINRFNNRNESCSFSIGEKISIDYFLVDEYRARLKSLMRATDNKSKKLL